MALTCRAFGKKFFVGLCYCFNELETTYVRLEKFQTDYLEARCGQYSQLLGAKYDISVRQVYEIEKKAKNDVSFGTYLNNQQLTPRQFQDNWKKFVRLENVAS